MRAHVAGAVAIAALLAFSFRAATAAALGPLDLARRISADPACTRSQVLGLCWCGAAPCGYLVRMYVPVAFVETVRSSADSLVLGASLAAPAAADTVSSSQSALDNTAEAHAWLLSDAAWLVAKGVPCMRCQPSDARSPPPAPSTAADFACGSTSAVLTALASSAASSFTSVLTALVYASEPDAVNWRTGCRDLVCAQDWLTQVAACTPSAVGSEQSTVATGTPACVGQWGALYPRQMRDLGTAPVVYSAKTAYRALSVARDQLGTLAFPVDLAGRLQQAYPVTSTCFGVGEQPLPSVQSSGQPVQISADGRYGWFYWRPVSCCIGFDSLAHCGAGTALR